MLDNYETNDVLKKVSNTISHYEEIGQKATLAAAANVNGVTYFCTNYSKISYDDRSDQENEENLNEISKQKYNASNLTYAHASNGGAIKRGCEVVDGENEDDLITFSTSSSSASLLTYSRRSPPKKPKFIVTSEEMNEFFKLLLHTDIQNFLIRDSCCLISDKYALAMVFTYFKRAKFSLAEYTLEHFFLALYLASDIEEDVDEYKYEIFPWALGNNWRSCFSGFLRKRDALLRRIGYRAIVSRKCCEEVMSFKAEHNAWKRERAQDHGGATRAYLINRSKRFLTSKNNLDDEDLNYPRMKYETPRPCPLCLISHGWNSANNTINLAIHHSIPKPNKLNNITNTYNNIIATNSSLASVSDSSNIYETTLNKSDSPIKKAPERNFITKRQKQSIIEFNPRKETIFTKSKSQSNSNNFEKSFKQISKTPKKSLTKSNLLIINKFKHQQKQSDENDSNFIKLKSCSKIPASNKFNQIKLSTTDLENYHRGFELPRRSSLASTDKLIIKDKASDYEDDNSYYDDDDDDDNDNDEGEETSETDEVFTNNNEKTLIKTQSLLKKQDSLRQNTRRSNTTKLMQANTINYGIRKRSNYSLSSCRNLSLKSTISTSTSSSKLEIKLNQLEFQRAQQLKSNF